MSEQSESALDKLLDSEKWDDDSYGACCRCPVSMLDLEAARAELERLRKKEKLCDEILSWVGSMSRRSDREEDWLQQRRAIQEGVARG